MKNLLNPLPAGGAPLTNETLLTLQDEPFIALRQLYLSIGGAFVISGCDLLSASGSTCSVSAGYVWLDGDVRRVEAYSGTYPFWVTPSDTYETRRYSNGAVQDTYVNRQTQFTTAQPSGASIAFNPANTELRVAKLVTADVTAALRQEALSRTRSEANLQKQITDLKNAPKVEIGGVIIWTTPTIPQGWALCDGTQGTPDLRGRFVVGFDSGQADYSVYGNTGGENQHTLSVNELPSHNHNASDGQFGYNQLLRKAPLGSNTTADGTDGSGNGGSEPDITTSQPMATVGGGLPHENRPPYFVLYYIMRIA